MQVGNLVAQLSAETSVYCHKSFLLQIDTPDTCRLVAEKSSYIK